MLRRLIARRPAEQVARPAASDDATRGVRLEGLEARSASLESVFLEIADGSDAPIPEPEGVLR